MPTPKSFLKDILLKSFFKRHSFTHTLKPVRKLIETHSKMWLLTICMMTALAEDMMFSCLKHCYVIHIGFSFVFSYPSSIGYPRSIQEDLNELIPHTHFISFPLQWLSTSVKTHSRAITLFYKVLLNFLLGSSTIPPLSPFSSLFHICAFSYPADAN